MLCCCVAESKSGLPFAEARPDGSAYDSAGRRCTDSRTVVVRGHGRVVAMAQPSQDFSRPGHAHNGMDLGRSQDGFGTDTANQSA